MAWYNPFATHPQTTKGGGLTYDFASDYDQMDPTDNWLSVDAPMEYGQNDLVSTVTTNECAIIVNKIVRGPLGYQRTGKRIRMHSLQLTGALDYTFTAPQLTGLAYGGTVRMVAVYMHGPMGGTQKPLFDEIFGTTSTAGARTCHILDPIRPEEIYKYEILADKRWTANPLTLSESSPVGYNWMSIQKTFNFTIPLCDRIADYNRSADSGSTPKTQAKSFEKGCILIYWRANINDTDQHWILRPESNARLTYRS